MKVHEKYQFCKIRIIKVPSIKLYKILIWKLYIYVISSSPLQKVAFKGTETQLKSEWLDKS
jgi:hypothetical protein